MGSGALLGVFWQQEDCWPRSLLSTRALPIAGAVFFGEFELLISTARIVFFGLVIALCLGALNQAQAQEPPELIQAVTDPHLGQVDLPGFWEVEPISDGVRAVESKAPQPAAIEVALRPLPTSIASEDLLAALVAELSGSMGQLAVKDEQSIAEDTRWAILEGEANSAPRLGVLIRVHEREVLMVILATPKDRFEQLGGQKLVQVVAASVKGSAQPE